MVNTFSAMGGFSFTILNLFDPPCIAAIGTIMREMGSKFWGWFAVLYQMVLGYVLATITDQLGHGYSMGQHSIWSDSINRMYFSNDLLHCKTST